MNKKALGNLKHINMDLDVPKMKFDIEYNSISLFIGYNGVGKSFILVLTWCISYLLLSYEHVKDVEYLKKFLTFVFTNSFNLKITGRIFAQFEPVDVMIDVKDGVVTDLSFDVREDFIPAFPVYMSTTTRLYHDIVVYIRMRNMIGVKEHPTEEQMEKLLTAYKLYDVMFCERLIKSLSTPLIFDAGIKSRIEKFGDHLKSIASLYYDPEQQNIFYTVDGGAVFKATSLSNGEQAMLNMFTANLLN